MESKLFQLLECIYDVDIQNLRDKQKKKLLKLCINRDAIPLEKRQGFEKDVIERWYQGYLPVDLCEIQKVLKKEKRVFSYRK